MTKKNFAQLIGAALTGIGVYLFLETREIGTCINDELAPLMVVLIAIGGVLLVTALLGLVGVCKKKSVVLSGVCFVCADDSHSGKYLYSVN